jgi:aminoglycoside phosphotransferase (APT) family kinase protein
VTEQQGTDEFDGAALGRLAHWLTVNGMGGQGYPRLVKFPGGQSNPTYRLEWGGEILALRRKPFGRLLPKAHAIEREYRVLKALSTTQVPVATVRGLCDDTSVIGASFYVMEFVQGRIFWDPRLPELHPTERRRIFAAMSGTVAQLHSVEPRTVGLESFGRVEGFMARQVSLWTAQYRASATREIPAMDALICWLPQNIPESPTGSIFHGDLRLDNLIFHATEPRVLAILDWELATLGDPIADLAYHIMIWRVPPELFRGLKGVDLSRLGIPTEQQYLDDYCRVSGRDLPSDMTFYLAFSFFRLAAILQGVARRGMDGNASAADAVSLGARAEPLAQIGWDMVT